MKWLRLFKRKREEEQDTRIYTVDSPRASRPHRPEVRNVPPPQHPAFQDFGALEIDESSAEDDANPYDTASWKLDPDKGIRRVEDDKTVDRKGRVKPSSNNPYDTGSYRKGW